MSVDRTVDYAGLEKATGVPSGDTRSDIFFLGCVFYEMITGRPPLTPTRDKYQRMQKHRFTDIPPIKPEEVNGPASVIRLAENMMSMDLGRRFQTPTQLLEAVRQVKTELGLAATPAPGLTPATSGGRGAVPTVFVVEADPRLQDAIRDKLRKIGYRALIASDPARAVERFGQQPFAGLIVDAGTTGQEGITGFQSILRDSRERKLSCKGILILSETQEPRDTLIPVGATGAILQRPITLGQLTTKLRELVPVEGA
jgi:CheY-like chemotaxis protein